jgi:hypothetical protein
VVSVSVVSIINSAIAKDTIIGGVGRKDYQSVARVVWNEWSSPLSDLAVSVHVERVIVSPNCNL